MALDNLNELNQPIKSKLLIAQKVVTVIEIAFAFLALVGFIFKKASFPYASEMITISFTGLSCLYVFLPILVFRSKNKIQYLIGQAAGIFLFIAIMGALFTIQSWPYASQMRYISSWSLPFMLVLLIILIVIKFKEEEKLNFYLRIGLRILLLSMLFNYN
jgi:hypothetical protein